MNDLIGTIIASVVGTIVTIILSYAKAKTTGILRSVIEGVEKGTKDLPAHEAEKIKAAIKDRAVATNNQAKLHSLVEKITKEPK